MRTKRPLENIVKHVTAANDSSKITTKNAVIIIHRKQPEVSREYTQKTRSP